MKRLVLVLACLLLAGCPGYTIQRFALTPAPLECQVTEVRTSVLATAVLKVCWDAQGRIILASAGDGKPLASVGTDLATVGAVVGVGLAVGSSIGKTTSVTVGP